VGVPPALPVNPVPPAPPAEPAHDPPVPPSAHAGGVLNAASRPQTKAAIRTGDAAHERQLASHAALRSLRNNRHFAKGHAGAFAARPKLAIGSPWDIYSEPSSPMRLDSSNGRFTGDMRSPTMAGLHYLCSRGGISAPCGETITASTRGTRLACTRLSATPSACRRWGHKRMWRSHSRRVRSTPTNGHRQTGPTGPFRATSGSGRLPSVPNDALAGIAAGHVGELAFKGRRGGPAVDPLHLH
jgi:hypothetical protein